MLEIVIIIYALLFGLCFGSFANVLIYRIPAGESIVRPPSHCIACGHRLTAADLIPVLSRLLLRGRCRYCGEHISRRYSVIEIMCAVLFVCMVIYTGFQAASVPLCAFAFTLLCVSCIDAETKEIPDGLIVFGAFVGMAWVAASCFLPLGAPIWYNALLGSLAGALPLLVIDRCCILLLGKDGFGYGDVKLMAMAGLFLGWQSALLSLAFAFIAGGAFGAVLLLTHRAERGIYLAFGPFLSAGVLASLWFGEGFMSLIFPF